MVDETEPVTLAEACEIVFRNKVKVATLRAEHARGRLDITRVGRTDFTTVRSVREMIAKCHVEGPRLASISIQDEGNGLSETDRASSAQAALRQTLSALKNPSASTSAKSTRRNGQHRH